MPDELSITLSANPEIVECGEYSFISLPILLDGKEIEHLIVPVDTEETL